MLTAFADPVFDSQRTFRELLQAMARPAVPRRLPVVPPSPAAVAPEAMAILLTLCDAATSIWLQRPDAEAVDHLRFHTGLRLADQPQQADFALIDDPASMPALACFAHGDPRYPDRSASLIVQVNGFRTDGGAHFAGPGIRDAERLSVEGLPSDFWQQRAALSTQFPLGLDLYFVAAQQVVAMPRTTRLLEA
ncbi:phosphonate C-P lyase system protein PhnH [Dyella nitratireducens]|uniref:Carbon-phosphorus lyase subunit PhnH n=1 Tax=Dyella nitratireducens TaxID=1849580 RepID=A0ABQ1FTQ2_9GAMM|nr:phosphonate C-P lyase system protein PhnH [Dyella nitratireducens]GGA28105.1 carbon-phosphorus lyase subunit PhnH [Dyella nitratireducens]GLQ43325.1 carbon-phosphorus lyase subunit PhnH [Dyella nitratireducens]